MRPDDSPADLHRAVAGGFTSIVEGTAPGDWDAPAPVEGWTARDVVRHLVTWFPGFLEGGSGVAVPAGPGVDADPVAAWRAQADGVQAVLDDPVASATAFSNPHTGEMPVEVAISRFYTGDVFMHTWDLARATGQPHGLDDELAGAMLAGMEPIEEMLRASGQYGPRVDVPDDADAVSRLMGFVGRDPS
ncbi:TIGR03086 family metal-binding protein [Nocardioides sp. C4-1]|uniref:TIGR03086 family metal-binding protein n=1 Tax=Nocardioides sp. C4-1 TaxID=3151851 RepID=UPI0032667ED7